MSGAAALFPFAIGLLDRISNALRRNHVCYMVVLDPGLIHPKKWESQAPAGTWLYGGDDAGKNLVGISDDRRTRPPFPGVVAGCPALALRNARIWLGTDSARGS